MLTLGIVVSDSCLSCPIILRNYCFASKIGRLASVGI